MALTYAQALDYIYSFTNYEIEPQYRYAPEVIDPKRPAFLLSMLGSPQKAFVSIHVAGTKGKGSVSAICASILQASGLRTGLYVSPHLVSFTERIQVNGEQIPQGELARLVESVRPAVAQVEGITTFEVITALAFLYFARQKVDIAVVEVGLGGRLDATNLIHPLVSVITSLSYDHTYLLGETLAEIAAEKGGIIKPGVPVVSALQMDEAMEVLDRLSAQRGASLTLVGPLESISQGWWYAVSEMTLEGQSFRAGRVGHPGEEYRLGLIGQHQALNATVALAAVEKIRGEFPMIDDEAIRKGLRDVNWPGRFQILHRRPVVVVDGAHNGDSATKLGNTLREMFPGQRCILVLGVTADKDVDGILVALMPVADEIITTAADHPRAAHPQDLSARLERLGARARTTLDVPSALDLAWSIAEPEDVICITGSLFVVGNTLSAWQKQISKKEMP